MKHKRTIHDGFNWLRWLPLYILLVVVGFVAIVAEAQQDLVIERYGDIFPWQPVEDCPDMPDGYIGVTDPWVIYKYQGVDDPRYNFKWYTSPRGHENYQGTYQLIYHRNYYRRDDTRLIYAGMYFWVGDSYPHPSCGVWIAPK
jgi:hypothetical protein